MTIPGTGKFTLALIAAAIACASLAGAARAELSATVDRTRVSTSDLLTLTVRLSGSTSSERPELPGIEKDFVVIDQNTRTNSSVTIVNGKQTSETHVDWIFTLRPKREGELTIPSIRLAGEQTQPITIKALAPSKAEQARGSRVVFFDTSVDTNSAYVQGQIIYTVKLYYTESISGDFPPPPDLENAVVETLENEKRYESIVNNRRYYVLEKRYAIFPQRSGELRIPPETFVGSRGRGGLFSQRERISAISRVHRIKVKPRPASFPGDNWLPAKSLEVSESWNKNPPSFVVGEPINRTLAIKAEGAPPSLLPRFDELALDNAKTYTDPPDTGTSVGENGLVATQTVTTGIVPTKAGTLTLPEIRIPWWNTDTNTLETAVIPGAAYQVDPAAGPLVQVPSEPVHENPAIDAANASSGAETNPAWWQYVAIGAALLWLFSTVQWLIARRDLKRIRQSIGPGDDSGPSPALDEPALFKAFRRACRASDPAAAQQRLIQWARAHDPAIASLRDLAGRAGEHGPALQAAIDNLEQTLYAPDAPANTRWHGDKLLSVVTALRRQTTRPTSSPNQRPAALTPSLNP